MFVLAHRWEAQTLLLITGVLLVGVSLSYTIYLQKKDRIHIPVWGWMMLIIALTLGALLLAVNLIPPAVGTVDRTTPVAPIPDSSAGID